MDYRVAVVGEGVIDRFVTGAEVNDVIGGSPLNTAVALQRAGIQTHWWARVSQGVEGAAIMEYASQNGVDHPALIRSPEPASIVTIELSTNGVPQYDFALEGSVDWQWTEDELSGLKNGYDVIQIGSLTSVMQPGSDKLLAVIQSIKSHTPKVMISFDPNARPKAALSETDADRMRGRILDFVTVADIVKVSDEDLEWIDSKHSPDESAQEWSLKGPKIVIMTRGENGATAFIAGQRVTHVDTVQTELIDTVGAGDTFMAWVLRGVISHNLSIPSDVDSVDELLRIAATAAAITCSRKGCNPPLLSEIVD